MFLWGIVFFGMIEGKICVCQFGRRRYFFHLDAMFSSSRGEMIHFDLHKYSCSTGTTQTKKNNQLPPKKKQTWQWKMAASAGGCFSSVILVFLGGDEQKFNSKGWPFSIDTMRQVGDKDPP